jgi:hypothetical protein
MRGDFFIRWNVVSRVRAMQLRRVLEKDDLRDPLLQGFFNPVPRVRVRNQTHQRDYVPGNEPVQSAYPA